MQHALRKLPRQPVVFLGPKDLAANSQATGRNKQAVPVTVPTNLAPLLGPSDLPVDHLVLEDDAPVDNIFSEREQRLLPDALYTSWKGPGKGRPFSAFADVGLFYDLHEPPLVPDFMLSLDVRLSNPKEKRNRSYLTWVFGKVPELVVEIVSNREGGEDTYKLGVYPQLGIRYYVIHDPEQFLGTKVLRVFELSGKKYKPIPGKWLPGVGLGLTLWQGEYERWPGVYLRWCDRRGRLLLTGEELAGHEKKRSRKLRKTAEQEKQRANRLAEQLRRLGVEPRD